MTSSWYFDTRTLKSEIGSERRCPVQGCVAVLQPRQFGKRSQLNCPDHEIEVHAKTFVYNKPLHNIPFESEYFERAFLHNKLKAETHRFGHENSEDALTWNVFAELARKKRLSEIVRRLFLIGATDEPELYLWGLRVDSDNQAQPKLFDALAVARRVFEPDISRLRTEPDIMLYSPGKLLVLIEAKFTSPNSIADTARKDVPGEKPKTPQGIVSRYGSEHLPAGSLLGSHPSQPLFSQLYRNLVFAIWMANKLKVEWRLVNLLTSRLHHNGLSDITKLADDVLPAETRSRCVPYTWEQLFHDHVEGRDELHELAAYLRFKSANCQAALAI